MQCYIRLSIIGMTGSLIYFSIKGFVRY